MPPDGTRRQPQMVPGRLGGPEGLRIVVTPAAQKAPASAFSLDLRFSQDFSGLLSQHQSTSVNIQSTYSQHPSQHPHKTYKTLAKLNISAHPLAPIKDLILFI